MSPADALLLEALESPDYHLHGWRLLLDLDLAKLPVTTDARGEDETPAFDIACLVWEAFAACGVGAGARGRVRGPTASMVAESFDLPPRCARP
jgi:hypothetical protein